MCAVTAEQFSKFRHESVHALELLNDQCGSVFKISSWERYDYDLDAGTLTFSQGGIPKVIASIFVAGTTSESAGNWLWSWGNGFMPELVSEPVKKVRDFGIEENIKELAEPYVPDEEHKGWELTAMAARIMQTKGAYRCPANNGFIYLLLMDLAFADLPASYGSKHTINCNKHGTAYATYVCEHLIAEPQQQWFSEGPNPENPWPDAWCAACDKFFREQGEWNEANESKLRIKLLCHYCYGTLHSKSQR